MWVCACVWGAVRVRVSLLADFICVVMYSQGLVLRVFPAIMTCISHQNVKYLITLPTTTKK